jgi:predicted RNA binding protein YcfA (HicA-like mRNA interferase family)
MPPLPVLPGLRVVRALEKASFAVVRIRGSHHVLRHPDGRGYPLSLSTGTKRCESVHFAGSCGIAD